VSQTVWIKLLENLASLREPRALPGWIRTTTTRASLQALMSTQRVVAMDPTESENYADRWGDQVDIAEDMFREECRRALRRGLAELAQHERDLLVLLAADPPLTYQQISTNLGLPMGSIGPSRARYLKKLRASTAIRTLELTAEPARAAA